MGQNKNACCTPETRPQQKGRVVNDQKPTMTMTVLANVYDHQTNGQQQFDKGSNATDTTALGQHEHRLMFSHHLPTERLTDHSVLDAICDDTLSGQFVRRGSFCCLWLGWFAGWLVRSFVPSFVGYACGQSSILSLEDTFPYMFPFICVINDHFRVIHSIEAFYYDVVVVSLEWRKICDDYYMDEIEYGSSSSYHRPNKHCLQPLLTTGQFVWLDFVSERCFGMWHFLLDIKGNRI